MEWLGTELLYCLGEDPSRPGLHDTPARWARMWLEFIDYDPGNCYTTFEASTDQMVVEFFWNQEIIYFLIILLIIIELTIMAGGYIFINAMPKLLTIRL